MNETQREVYDICCDAMDGLGPRDSAVLIAALLAVHLVAHPAGQRFAQEELHGLVNDALRHLAVSLEEDDDDGDETAH